MGGDKRFVRIATGELLPFLNPRHDCSRQRDLEACRALSKEADAPEFVAFGRYVWTALSIQPTVGAIILFG